MVDELVALVIEQTDGAIEEGNDEKMTEQGWTWCICPECELEYPRTEIPQVLLVTT